MSSSPGDHPAGATAVLTTGLALLSVGLVARGHDHRLVVAPVAAPAWVLVLGLAALFGLAELCLLHVEVRREAYSVTLAGLPLVLGLLLCDPGELVLARVVGSAVAFAVQRSPVAKVLYNLAAYAAEAAVDATLLHGLLGDDGRLTGHTAVVAYLVVLAVDQATSWLVTCVIGWHQGRLTAGEAARIHLPALVCSVLSTTVAYAVLLLAGQGTVGAIVLVVSVLALGATYRGFQVLHRRHRSLEQVHEFVRLAEDQGTAQDLAGRMLGEVRELMRAASAELLLVDTHGDAELELWVGEDGPPSSRPGGWALDDALVARVRAEAVPVLVPAGARRRGDRTWLDGRGVRDAVIVPVLRTWGDGALMVFDRLGNTGSFTGEDLSMLQTLAGHTAVAVRSGALVDQLRHEATHDVLTGLANRSLLQQTLAAGSTTGPQRTGAVLLVDLDRFKEVNDTLGHHVGDALLRSVAATIRAALPAGATVARLGGDEFAAVLPDPADQATVLALARELAQMIAVPVQFPETLLSTRASIGVALAGTTTTHTDPDLLRQADTAMYAAKETGEPVVLYTPELDRGRAERLALLADLHLALDRSELVVVYQPKLDLTTDRIDSVEALVRWQHPRLGLLTPDTFVPLAEANGLIGPLTEQVLAAALRQSAAWRADGLDLAVAVNLSARTVTDAGLPRLVTDALLDAGVPPSRLILEITESSVMDDPDRAVSVLETIAGIGVTLALDDFGTGYSSLAYLQRLPVSEVKIDRSFVTGLVTDPDRGQVLVRTIITLATNLGHRVVAEGAEDTETVDLLRRLGCHLVQGYAISPPDHPDRIAALVHARAERARPALVLAT